MKLETENDLESLLTSETCEKLSFSSDINKVKLELRDEVALDQQHLTILSTPLRFLPIPPTEVSLAHVLKCGQSFRWQKTKTRVTFTGIEDDTMTEWCMGWEDRTIVLRQDRNGIHYRALYNIESTYAHKEDLDSDTTLAFLRRYFALSENINLANLYRTWSERDKNFAKKTSDSRFAGIRVLRQDAWETLISFICSSNNNISRISLMLSRLCARFGTPVPSPSKFSQKDDDPLIECYSFPLPERLAEPDVETTLRELGFGYRAAYVYKTAHLLCKLSPKSPIKYLMDLSSLSMLEARAKLLEFCGVGPKVADCILLFGLRFDDVVPVDTHVYQIAVRDYGFKGGGGSSQSQQILSRVSKRLQDVWGLKSGWAHQILFTADLKSFESFVDVLAKPEIKSSNIIPFIPSISTTTENSKYSPPSSPLTSPLSSPAREPSIGIRSKKRKSNAPTRKSSIRSSKKR